MTEDDDWPFADPKNLAVFTTASVLEDGSVITYVTHDADDGAWQFHGANETDNLDDARLVALSAIYQLDRSIGSLADLPLGWHAWRATRDDDWIRTESSD